MWLILLYFSGRRYRRYRTLFWDDNAFGLGYDAVFIAFFGAALSTLSTLSVFPQFDWRLRIGRSHFWATRFASA
jgi:hypothetical protein